MRFPFARTLLLLLICGAGTATAGTWRVGRNVDDCDPPCHFHDDQDPTTPDPGGGVRRAMLHPAVLPGDSVEVWPGVYFRSFDMEQDVVLFSHAGPDVTTLGEAASGVDPLCRIVGGSPLTVIDGFTFVWDAQGNGTGGGIAAYASDAVIRNNVFRDCRASIGAAVYLQFCHVTLENNVFDDNVSTGGGGVVAATSGAPVLRNNTFRRCRIPFGFDGAAFYSSGSAAVFDRNIVIESEGGAAVFCAGPTGGAVTCNLFWDNPLGAFGGTCVDSTGVSGNFHADPLLCDPDAGDFALCLDSPALDPACGPVGYVSPAGNCPACGAVLVAEGVQTLSWGRIKDRYHSAPGP